MKFLSNLGCMQGRLSPMINNKRQCFPSRHWKDEFLHANSLGLKFIEWTLDYKKIFSNPIFNSSIKFELFKPGNSAVKRFSYR